MTSFFKEGASFLGLNRKTLAKYSVGASLVLTPFLSGMAQEKTEKNDDTSDSWEWAMNERVVNGDTIFSPSAALGSAQQHLKDTTVLPIDSALFVQNDSLLSNKVTPKEDIEDTKTKTVHKQHSTALKWGQPDEGTFTLSLEWRRYFGETGMYFGKKLSMDWVTALQTVTGSSVPSRGNPQNGNFKPGNFYDNGGYGFALKLGMDKNITDRLSLDINAGVTLAVIGPDGFGSNFQFKQNKYNGYTFLYDTPYMYGFIPNAQVGLNYHFEKGFFQETELGVYVNAVEGQKVEGYNWKAYAPNMVPIDGVGTSLSVQISYPVDKFTNKTKTKKSKKKSTYISQSDVDNTYNNRSQTIMFGAPEKTYGSTDTQTLVQKTMAFSENMTRSKEDPLLESFREGLAEIGIVEHLGEYYLVPVIPVHLKIQ